MPLGEIELVELVGTDEVADAAEAVHFGAKGTGQRDGRRSDL
jgi:hypothetical protein